MDKQNKQRMIYNFEIYSDMINIGSLALSLTLFVTLDSLHNPQCKHWDSKL